MNLTLNVPAALSANSLAAASAKSGGLEGAKGWSEVLLAGAEVADPAPPQRP